MAKKQKQLIHIAASSIFFSMEGTVPEARSVAFLTSVRDNFVKQKERRKKNEGDLYTPEQVKEAIASKLKVSCCAVLP